MKIFGLLFLMISTLRSYSQDPWASWDAKYFLTNYDSLIQSELNYAKAVESNPNEIQYYCRSKGYKFIGHFLHQSRPIDTAELASIKRVYKLTGGQWPFSDQMNEYLVEINGTQVWAAMQPQLEKPFKKESKKIKDITLYCSFFNEHMKDNKLYNTILISEFH